MTAVSAGGDFFRRVYRKVREVPRGRVATYGQIASLLGSPRAARTVGWALQALDDGSGVPWHRVVDAEGRIRVGARGGAADLQMRLLRREGVAVNREGTVDLGRFLWNAAAPSAVRSGASPNGRVPP